MSTEVEIAWAAGLFEGEGCITASTRSDGYVKYVSIQLVMCDLDVVMKFARIVGIENVKTYAGVTKNRKQRHYVQTNKISEVERIFWMLAPHLGERRLKRGAELLVAYRGCR